MRQQYIFIIFCLILTLGFTHSYGVFKEYFSDAKDLKNELALAKQAQEREQLRLALLKDQMQDFQIEVARTLPKDTFQQQNILAQVRLPASDSPVEMSAVLLEKGRKLFREQNYPQAIIAFQEVIEKFPISGRAIEARFLMAESYFMVGRFPECVDQVEEMMTHYPQHDLTGFIMLRMGQVLHSRNRPEEAREVFRTVQRRFPASRELQTQSALLLKK